MNFPYYTTIQTPNNEVPDYIIEEDDFCKKYAFGSTSNALESQEISSVDTVQNDDEHHINISQNDRFDMISIGSFADDHQVDSTSKQIPIENFFGNGPLNIYTEYDFSSTCYSGNVERQKTGITEPESPLLIASDFGAQRRCSVKIETRSKALVQCSFDANILKKRPKKITKARGFEISSHIKDDNSKQTKPRVVTARGSRKCDIILKLLIAQYYKYQGQWDDEIFKDVMADTGFNKKQLNKWFWDRKQKKNRELEAKKVTYPGLIFQITNMETGKDLTPDIAKICCKPIFTIEKVLKN